MFGTESPDPVNDLPRNSKGDRSPSETDAIEETLGLISIISVALFLSILIISNPYVNES